MSDSHGSTPKPQPLPPARFGDRLLARLSRVTSGGRFIPEIDGLRFLAIATVVLHHLLTLVEERVIDARLGAGVREAGQNWLLWLVHHGAVGVQVFFAISGFILAMPFAKAALDGGKPVKLGEYFWRRITRLEPPFVVSMLMLYFAWAVVVPRMGMAVEHSPGPGNLAASLAYAHYLWYGTPSLVNGVTWSLEIEVQFYILMPLFATIFSIRNKLARRAVMVAVMATTATIKGLYDKELESVHLSLTLLGYLHCFFVGLLVADIYITDWKNKPQKGSWAWDLAGLAGLAGIVPQGAGGNAELWRIALFLPSMVLIFIAAFRGRAVQAFFSNRWVATIGGMCYSIYLLHYAVLFASLAVAVKVLDKLAPRFGENWFVLGRGSEHAPLLNFLLWCVILLPVVLVVSSVFFVLIERPCMVKDWPQRLLARLGLRKASDSGRA